MEDTLIIKGDVKTIDVSQQFQVGGMLHYENKLKLSFDQFWGMNRFPDELKSFMELKYNYPTLSNRQVIKMLNQDKPSRAELRKQSRMDKKRIKINKKKVSFSAVDP